MIANLHKKIVKYVTENQTQEPLDQFLFFNIVEKA